MTRPPTPENAAEFATRPRAPVASAIPSIDRSAPLQFVINTGSGSGDTDSRRTAIEAALRAGGRKGNLRLTNPAEIVPAAQAAARDALQLRSAVVAVGGDGTINAVAQAAHRTGCVMGVVPQGTYNFFARMHGIPAFVFGHLKYVTTNAVSSAPVAGDQPSYPVLLFLEGATGFRQMNTFQVEDLVSHGYIVAAIDQPGVAALVVFPDGRQAGALTLAQIRATVAPSYLPHQTAPLLNGRTLPGGSIIPFLAQDASFALDQLAAVNQADPNGIDGSLYPVWIFT